MNNVPPTSKEKLLMKVLVRKFSQEELNQELYDIQTQGLTSSKVKKTAQLLGIKLKDDRFSSQYLKYAVDNYGSIKEKNFPDEFERMVELNVKITEQAKQWVTTYYEIQIPYLKSFSEKLIEDINTSYWQYDPTEVDSDYQGDRETEDVEIEIEADGELRNNIIG